MSLPIFCRPGAVAVVDDDEDFLRMLATRLPPAWKYSFFSDGHRLLRHIEAEVLFYEADIWTQQQALERWAAGGPLVPRILEYWTESTQRFALTRVCVVDRRMPLDGFEVLEQLRGWDGRKLLLTGHVDNAEAIEAFNAGLIDKFVAKQSASLAQSLDAAIGSLQRRAMPRLDQVWRATLSTDLIAILTRASAMRELGAWARETFLEYIVIGSPFGVLGVGASGQLGWIQLVPEGDKPSAPVTDADIRAQFGQRETAVASHVRTLGDAGLRGAYFALDWVPGVDKRDWTYAAWLAREPKRLY